MHSLMAAPTSKTVTNAALWKQNSRNCHNPGPLSGAKLLSFVAGFDTHSSETAFTPLRKSIVPIPCPTWYWLAGAQAVWKTKLQAWNLQIRSQQLPVTQQWYSNGTAMVTHSFRFRHRNGNNDGQVPRKSGISPGPMGNKGVIRIMAYGSKLGTQVGDSMDILSITK